MNKLKQILISSLDLIFIDYSSDARLIILYVNTSFKKWDDILMQLISSKRHSIKYESEIWSNAKAKYDATKRECRRMLKILKKIRFWLYEVHFVLKTNVEVLITQLNEVAIDLSSALLTRWIAWIRLFNFDVKHVSEKKHIATNELSRRSATKTEIKVKSRKLDINDFIDAKLNFLRICSISISDDELILNASYSNKSQKITIYLTSLRRSIEMIVKEFQVFKNEILRFRVEREHLFRRNSKNVSSRRIVNRLKDKFRIIQKLHDESEHQDRENIYRRIANRYWWDNMHQEIKFYI
jgi:hypothetical protein